MHDKSLHNLTERVKKIKAVALDGDGVFFTGRVFIHPKDGEFLKERSLVDGQGISMLRASGIYVAFISAEKTGFIERVGEKLNNLPSVKNGDWPPVGIFTGFQGYEKVVELGRWLESVSVKWEECAYMGDDLSDYEIFQKVGLATVPAQGEKIMKKIAHYVTTRDGGDGAIRDLANFILEAKGIDAVSLARR